MVKSFSWAIITQLMTANSVFDLWQEISFGKWPTIYSLHCKINHITSYAA